MNWIELNWGSVGGKKIRKNVEGRNKERKENEKNRRISEWIYARLNK